jgi:hypothetical protein
MPWSWSSPSAGQSNTMADIAARGNPVGPQANFGALVAAILANKKHEQDQMNQALSGVEKGVGGYLQGQQQGQLADYQQTMSQSQPGGIVTDPNDPNYNADLWQQDVRNEGQGVMDNMSPQARLQAMQWQQAHDQQAAKQAWDQRQHDLMSDNLRARTNASNAMADQRRYNTQWSENDQPDVKSTIDTRRQQIIDQASTRQQKEQLANMLGIPVKDLPGAIGALNAYQPGDPNSKVKASPQNLFPDIGSVKGTDLSGEDKQARLDAARAYQSILGGGHPLSQIPGNHPAYASPSLPTGARSQAVGERGETIPGVSTGNVTSGRAGAGPLDSDIGYLLAHPEVADKFDARFGQGMASQYLRQ